MADPQNSPRRPRLNLVARIAILEVVLIALSIVLGPVIARVLFPSASPAMTTGAVTAAVQVLTYITPTAPLAEVGSATLAVVMASSPTLLPTLAETITASPQPTAATATSQPAVITMTPQPSATAGPPTQAAPLPEPKTATPQAKTATPQAKTATPQTKTLVMTDQQATDLARGNVPANVLQNPVVAFTNASMEITGITNIPLLKVSGPTKIVCKPQVADEQLWIGVLSVTIGGTDVTQFVGARIEQAINGSFAGVSAGKRVQNIVLSAGSLTVVYLE